MAGQLSNRPYVGSWQLNNKEVLAYTPDALVYFNGDTAIPGCPTCGGRIDLQPWIIGVDCDPSVDPPATANVNIQMPRHIGDTLYRDGQMLLRPGLEIHIYFRGYFPVTGILAGMSPEETGGVDVSNSVMFPYYLCFHGVVVEVSHEYSGGEHSISLSCSDLLHFWEYQRMSSQGSLFGARPSNSGVKWSLVGNNFTGMSPYSIIYTLYRDVMGAAGGVEYAMGNKTNAAATSSVMGESLWQMTILYWQARFASSVNRLRMYGIEGTLYNTSQQAFLGSLRGKDAAALGRRMADKNKQTNEKDPMAKKEMTARILGFDPHSMFAQAESEDTAKTKDAGICIPQIHAFVTDINNWGQVNFFESAYMTKMEVANTVKEAVGFEFYQDVDGDIVFKPPFYNLDTSASRVYVIKPIDIISFSVNEKEPQATVVKGTGSWWRNIHIGVDGEWGTRGEFIDYRLVAQFGWRQQTFETSYHTSPKAIFWAAVSRFDLFNIEVKSASCQIPMRPELRPGYPVYIEHLDCFYYLRAFNHSFSFGGQCSTNLTLVGKRAKFYPPGHRPEDGTRPTVDDIDLSDPHLPSIPLEVIEGGQPRLQGFPNVVMTLDTENIDPLQFMRGAAPSDYTSKEAMKQLIVILRDKVGCIQVDTSRATTTDQRTLMENGPWQIQAANGLWEPLPSLEELTGQATTLTAIYATAAKQPLEKAAETRAAGDAQAPALTLLISSARTAFQRAFDGDPESSIARLEMLNDLKAQFNPGESMPGYYRYYSSAHPKAEQQGPRGVNYDEAGGVLSPGPLAACSGTCTQLQNDSGSNSLNTSGSYSAGIPLLSGGKVVPTPTHEIQNLQFAQFTVNRTASETSTLEGYDGSYDATRFTAALTKVLVEGFNQMSPEMGDNLSDSVVNRGYWGVLGGVAKAVIGASGYENITLFDPASRLSLVDATFLVSRDVTVGGAVFTSAGFSTSGGSSRNLLSSYGDTLEEAVQALAAQCAAIIAHDSIEVLTLRLQEDYVGQLNQTSIGANSAEAVDASWAQMWASVGLRAPSIKPSKKITVWKTKADTHIAPVFPVSDERGYEVVGTYRYGRGMSIEEGGSFDQLNSINASQAISYDEAEDLVNAVSNTTDYAAVLASLDPEKRAALAVEGNWELALDEKAEGTAQRWVVNFHSDSLETTQKVKVVNAAYSLAQLGAYVHNTEVCSCRGAEASVLLQAFDDQGFLAVDQPDNVTQWLADQTAASSVAWKLGQDAVAGQVLDTRSSGIFETAVIAYSGGAAQVQSAAASFRDAVAALDEEG